MHGGMLKIGKSKARVTMQTETGVTFKDVAGIDEARARVSATPDGLARQIAGAGLRTELIRIRPREGKAFIRSLVGIDYASANTLTLSAEFYRDGIGAGNTAAYDFAPMTLRRWPAACGRHWPSAMSVCMQTTRSRRCSN